MLNSFDNYFFIAFEPRSKPFFSVPEVNKFFPRVKTLPNIPAPCCILRFLCRFGPIIWALFIGTFLGKIFLLTLSYLATKKRPSGKVTRFGVNFRLSNILSQTVSSAPASFSFTAKYSFITILPTEPRIGVANAAIGKASPFCLRLFLLPPIYQMLHLTDCFFILKSCHSIVLWYMSYEEVLALGVIGRINILQGNRLIFLALVYVSRPFLIGWQDLFWNHFFLIFQSLLHSQHLLLDQDISFHHF